MKPQFKSYIINLIGVIVLYAILMGIGFVKDYFQAVIIFIGINIIFAVSLNLATGFLGELALGHAGFIAVGAYTGAIFTKTVDMPFYLEFPIAIIFAGIVAGIFGIIIGIPTLRLKGDYLGIITLGFGEIIRYSIYNIKAIGGARGINNIAEYSNLTNVFIITVFVILIIHNFIKSRHGRAVLSIREDNIAAEAVGIPTTYYKILGFAMSAMFAGVGGAILAHYQRSIDPRKFDLIFSVEILIIVVLGGMGSITGSIVAAIILSVLNEVLLQFQEIRMVIYSSILIIMMIFRPEGILGKREFSLNGFLELLNKKYSAGIKN